MSYKRKIPKGQINARNKRPESVEKALLKRIAPRAEEETWNYDYKLFCFIDDSIDAEFDAKRYAERYSEKNGADSEW